MREHPFSIIPKVKLWVEYMNGSKLYRVVWLGKTWFCFLTKAKEGM